MKKLDSAGNVVATWGGIGSGDGQFRFPSDVEVNVSGEIFVTDRANNRVQKLAPDGSFLDKWGTGGAANGQFDQPLGLTIDDTGEILVVDNLNDRIQRFREAGYPRPKAATPLFLPLVLAYTACDAGSATKIHVPPLAYASCTAIQASSRLTVGSPDANMKAANSTGYIKAVRLGDQPSRPTTPTCAWSPTSRTSETRPT